MNAMKMTPIAIEELADRIMRMKSRTLAWDLVADCGDHFADLVNSELEGCADTDDETPQFIAKALRRLVN